MVSLVWAAARRDAVMQYRRRGTTRACADQRHDPPPPPRQKSRLGIEKARALLAQAGEALDEAAQGEGA